MEAESLSLQPEGFSFLVAVAFSLNYIMGTGFLTLPWAFYVAGLGTGIITLILTCIIAIIAVFFLLEALSRGEMLEGHSEWLKQNNNRTYKSINTDESNDVITMNPSEYGVTELKIEIPELCELFLGMNGRRIYIFMLATYMYGTLWAYSTVFANAFSAHLPLSSNTFDMSYYSYLILFGFIVIPTTCMELKEQVVFQVILAIGRVVMVALMVGSIAWAHLSDSNPFHDPSSPSSTSTSTSYISNANMSTNEIHTKNHYFNIHRLYLLLPIAVYANIFHHSIPALSDPIRNKSQLGAVYSITLTFCCFAYISISILIASFFGPETKSSSNLNWQYYGSGTYIGELISFYVVLFPALDVASVFPLCGITLGNNLMSFYYRDRMHSAESHRDLRIKFRILAATPPLIAALFSSDLGVITDYTGLFGFAIALVYPALLSIYSKKKMILLGLPVVTRYTSIKMSGACAVFIAAFGVFMIAFVFLCMLFPPDDASIQN